MEKSNLVQSNFPSDNFVDEVHKSAQAHQENVNNFISLLSKYDKETMNKVKNLPDFHTDESMREFDDFLKKLKTDNFIGNNLDLISKTMDPFSQFTITTKSKKQPLHKQPHVRKKWLRDLFTNSLLIYPLEKTQKISIVDTDFALCGAMSQIQAKDFLVKFDIHHNYSCTIVEPIDMELDIEKLERDSLVAKPVDLRRFPATLYWEILGKNKKRILVNQATHSCYHKRQTDDILFHEIETSRQNTAIPLVSYCVHNGEDYDYLLNRELRKRDICESLAGSMSSRRLKKKSPFFRRAQKQLEIVFNNFITNQQQMKLNKLQNFLGPLISKYIYFFINLFGFTFFWDFGQRRISKPTIALCTELLAACTEIISNQRGRSIRRQHPPVLYDQKKKNLKRRKEEEKITDQLSAHNHLEKTFLNKIEKTSSGVYMLGDVVGLHATSSRPLLLGQCIEEDRNTVFLMETVETTNTCSFENKSELHFGLNHEDFRSIICRYYKNDNNIKINHDLSNNFYKNGNSSVLLSSFLCSITPNLVDTFFPDEFQPITTNPKNCILSIPALEHFTWEKDIYRQYYNLLYCLAEEFTAILEWTNNNEGNENNNLSTSDLNRIRDTYIMKTTLLETCKFLQKMNKNNDSFADCRSNIDKLTAYCERWIEVATRHSLQLCEYNTFEENTKNLKNYFNDNNSIIFYNLSILVSALYAITNNNGRPDIFKQNIFNDKNNISEDLKNVKDFFSQQDEIDFKNFMFRHEMTEAKSTQMNIKADYIDISQTLLGSGQKLVIFLQKKNNNIPLNCIEMIQTKKNLKEIVTRCSSEKDFLKNMNKNYLYELPENANYSFPVNSSFPDEECLHDNIWERYNLSLFIRIMLALLLLDGGRVSYYFVITIFVLYVQGLLDPLLDFMTALSHAQPFEVTMNSLRQRQEAINQVRRHRQEEQQQATSSTNTCIEAESITPVIEGTNVILTEPIDNDSNLTSRSCETDKDNNKANESFSYNEEGNWNIPPGNSSPDEKQIDNLPDLPYSSIEDHTRQIQCFSPISPSTPVSEQTNKVKDEQPIITDKQTPVGQTQQVEAANSTDRVADLVDSVLSTYGTTNQNDGPPLWLRFLYQNIFMLIMTILPWWNPNPVYLQ